MTYVWSDGDAGNELRAQRIREIESRMDAFLLEKEGIAETNILRKVQAARETVRRLSAAS